MTSLLEHHLASSASNEELTRKYLELAQFYDNKQWHQLTNALDVLISNEAAFWQARNMLDLYHDFVCKFETKINPMRLAVFCAKASKQFFSSQREASEYQAALEFMDQIHAKVTKLPGGGFEASLVCKMHICTLLCEQGQIPAAQQVLKETLPKLNMLEGSVFEKQVKASFYLAQSAVLRTTGPAGAFFRSMMNYFAQRPELPASGERLALAVDVAVAALVAEDVFNFGEILQYDIIKQELSTRASHAWLYQMLVLFNEGRVGDFSQLLEENHNAMLESPTLLASLDTLRKKIALLSLVCLVFDRPNQERDLKFVEIANATRVPLDQVEWLVMSAFSKNLLRGWVDGIEEVVHVSWIMPRVLDEAQMQILANKLESWSHNVDVALTYETIVPELFAS